MNQIATLFVDEMAVFVEDALNTPFAMGNQWFYTKDYSIYVRVARRSLDGVERYTLELPNSTIRRPGGGLFTAILDPVEKYVAAHPVLDTVYGENVIEERLQKFFINRGYIPLGTGWNGVFTLYKILF